MSAAFPPRLGPVLERLRTGQRWWPAEIGARLLALVLLAGFWRLALVEHARAITPRVHPATLPDLLLCAALVALLLCALLLGIAGPGLLRPGRPAGFARGPLQRAGRLRLSTALGFPAQGTVPGPRLCFFDDEFPRR
ncbi:MAG: hypothetical protein K0R64_2579 [Novosphingobium lindaniclasticum]|jgi:hypothetical protein|uniref:hypothetical protein n=1 Tax=Novosphingobium lindaniclasticum TaxID=1329895 RepID=UPI00240A461C|nr:hypothetical protein [Novosphingobium lindaniclasticum]MDF2639595.1 hypothetical protein [Novosphingobium lindaniclasticum]